MEKKLITLAIHTRGKADVLKQLLERNGIEVFLEEVENEKSPGNAGFYVRIDEINLTRALVIVEENNLFSYNDQQTYKIDDGRKRILVAVDFSDYSFNACQIAFHIAKQIDAKVKILHVYHNVYFPSSLPFADTLKSKNDVGLLDKVRKQMLDLCCEIDQRIRDDEFPSVNYSYSIREGIVEEEIENFVKEYKPTLLVVGTKGKDNNDSRMLGNVTADIIEMTNVPVLAVPEKSFDHYKSGIKHIAFLTNFQERDMVSFDMLVKIIQPMDDVKITLIHINVIDKKGQRWGEEELAKMKEYFMKQYPQLNVAYKLIDTPDMLEAMIDFAENEKVSVVALNSRRRNLLGRIFTPSIPRKILYKSDVAILVLRG